MEHTERHVARKRAAGCDQFDFAEDGSRGPQGDRVLHFLGLVVSRFDVGLYVKSRDMLASLASMRETHGR